MDAGVVVAGVTDAYLGAAPDIGAYEFGAASYWIPGQRVAKASWPCDAWDPSPSQSAPHARRL